MLIAHSAPFIHDTQTETVPSQDISQTHSHTNTHKHMPSTVFQSDIHTYNAIERSDIFKRFVWPVINIVSDPSAVSPISTYTLRNFWFLFSFGRLFEKKRQWNEFQTTQLRLEKSKHVNGFYNTNFIVSFMLCK